jgi:hypothetical protein
MAAEWHHHASEDPVRCMLVFDVEKVKKLAKEIRRHWSQLIFDKRSQLHNTAGDGHLFDLWTASRNIPELQQQVLHCVRNSQQALQHRPTPTPHCRSDRCCYPCKRARAMSVEARPPKKWKNLHADSKWTRFLGNVITHPPPKPTKLLYTQISFPTIPRNIIPRKKSKTN